VAATSKFFPLNVHTLKRLALGIFAIPPKLVSCCRSIPLSLWRRESPKLQQHIYQTSILKTMQQLLAASG